MRSRRQALYGSLLAETVFINKKGDGTAVTLNNYMRLKGLGAGVTQKHRYKHKQQQTAKRCNHPQTPSAGKFAGKQQPGKRQQGYHDNNDSSDYSQSGEGLPCKEQIQQEYCSIAQNNFDH